MTIGQYYALPLNDDTRDTVSPGAFVFESNESEMVIGFISRVNFQSDTMEICLFEPTEMPDHADVIHMALTKDAMVSYLDGALAENPFAAQQWSDALYK